MNHMFAVRCIRRLWRLGQRRCRHQVRTFSFHPCFWPRQLILIWYKKRITVCIGMSMWTSWPQVGLPDRVAWQRPWVPPSSPPYRPGLLDQASYLFLWCMNLYNMAWLLTILTRFEARIWKLWSRDLFIFIYISQGGPLKLCRAQRVPHRTAKEAFSMIFFRKWSNTN